MIDGRTTARERWTWAVALTLLVGAATYTLLPLRHVQRGWNDFAFIYVAGRAWVKGLSPFDVDAYRPLWSAVTPSSFEGVWPQGLTYMYPPHFALLAVPLSLLGWPAAARVWDAIGILSFVAAVVLSLRIVSLRRRGVASDPWWWVFLGLATLNAAVRWTLRGGQMPLLPLVGVVGAFWALAEKRTAWLAVFAFTAALKPQIGFVPLLYIALNGGLAGVVWGGVAALVVGGAAMAPTHLALFPSQLVNCFRSHQSIGFNTPDQMDGMLALLARFDRNRRFVLLTPLLSIAFTSWLTRARRVGGTALSAALADPAKQAALVIAGTAAIMPLHSYDLVIYSPLMLFAYDIRPRWLALAIAGLAEIVPREAWTSRLPLHPAGPWFTLAIAVCTFAAILAPSGSGRRLQAGAEVVVPQPQPPEPR
jgi:hypothetical protein